MLAKITRKKGSFGGERSRTHVLHGLLQRPGRQLQALYRQDARVQVDGRIGIHQHRFDHHMGRVGIDEAATVVVLVVVQRVDEVGSKRREVGGHDAIAEAVGTFRVREVGEDAVERPRVGGIPVGYEAIERAVGLYMR